MRDESLDATDIFVVGGGIFTIIDIDSHKYSDLSRHIKELKKHIIVRHIRVLL